MPICNPTVTYIVHPFGTGRYSRPTKKAEEKNVAFSSQLKKDKLSKYVRNSSNLWRSSRKLAHRIDFSNIVDDPIEVEEVEDPSEDSEQGSTFGEEASSKDDSQDITSTPDETEMTEDTLDERATAIGEG